MLALQVLGYLHTGHGMQALQALGAPAYKVGHAGLMGPVSTCIQGITCRPYSSWGYLHTGHVMQAFQVLGDLHTR